MGPRQLLAVLVITDYGSFIAAASLLKTSQSTLTWMIQRIEDVLGVSLFERITRPVQFTAAGRESVAVAKRVLNGLRASIRSIREIADQEREQVIAGSIMSVAKAWLPWALADCHRSRPRLQST